MTRQKLNRNEIDLQPLKLRPAALEQITTKDEGSVQIQEQFMVKSA